MRQDEREMLREHFQYRCGYCYVRESDVGAELTTDHFQPRSRGGTHDAGNWVYSCHACNEFKGDFWDPDSPRRLLHPIRDNIVEHIVQEVDGTLRALTTTGAFHIEQLHLNRRPLIAYRRERLKLDQAQRTQGELLARLSKLEVQVQRVLAELSRLQTGDLNS